jgi:flagellar biosynthesis anti-sigma factor FlgM
MRIDLTSHRGAAIESGDTASRAAERTAGRSQSNALGVDEASLSSNKSNLRALELQASQMPECRTAKVTALREQIAQGSYGVDATKIAEALTREVV